MRLVIWDTLDRRPAALLQELATCYELDLTWTSDPAAVKVACAGDASALVLVAVRGAPVGDRAALIERIAGRFYAVALVAAPTRAAVRTLLDLGVREVFAEPIEPRRVLASIRAQLHGQRGSGAVTAAMRPVDPVACTVHVCGRAETLPARWCSVASGAFELATPARLEEGATIEVNGLPHHLISAAGLFGRVVLVETQPGAPARVRCEALPVSDRAPLSVDSSAGGAPRRSSIASAPAPVRLRLELDPAVLGFMVVALLLMAGLGWMGARQTELPVPRPPATTREVLEGIRRAFE